MGAAFLWLCPGFPAGWLAGMKAISIKMRLTAHKATHLPHLLRFPVNFHTHSYRGSCRSTMSLANDRRLAGYRLKSLVSSEAVAVINGSENARS